MRSRTGLVLLAMTLSLGALRPCDADFARYLERSPIAHLRPTLNIPIEIAHGDDDPQVAVRHALRAFELLAPGAVSAMDRPQMNRVPESQRLVVWEARHDNGWTTVVMEQPDGIFVAWVGRGESIGVDYVEDTPEHAQATAMFALRRKTDHIQCSPGCTEWEMRVHVRQPGP